MPHIRFRGTKDQTVSQISTRNKELAKIINTEASNFTFENIQIKYFEAGQATNGYPFVEVLWFARSQEVKQATASFLTEAIKQIESHEYVTVIFVDLEPSSYFENGKHF